MRQIQQNIMRIAERGRHITIYISGKTVFSKL